MNFIKKIIKNHLSLIIILIGAVSFFINNIVLESKLNASDYGLYSLTITYISLVYIYGLLGFEQVFLRYSFSSEENIITTQKINILIIIGTSFITSLLSTFIFKNYYLKDNYNTLLLFLATFSVIISMPIFSIFRLNKQFSLAQLVSNYWKICLSIISIFIFITNQFSITLITNSLFVIIILFSFIIVVYFLKNIKFSFNNDVSKKTIFQAFLFFFISITSFSIITFGDKFLIEERIGLQAVGVYFFLSNFILAPFNILQNYIGFKQLVEYKNGIDRKKMSKNIINVLILSITLSLLLIALFFIVEKFNIIDFKFSFYRLEIILFLILGVIKLYSSIVSPAFEVTTNLTMLKILNIALIISTLLTIIILYLLLNLTISIVLIALIILWWIRSIIQHYLIFNSVKNN